MNLKFSLIFFFLVLYEGIEGGKLFTNLKIRKINKIKIKGW